MKLNPDNVYDPLAKEYDAILLADPKNKGIREYVRRTALSYLTNKSVAMDFGGGTGQDLPWLSECANKLLFCEPSEKMRAFAVSKIVELQLKNVALVVETDFRKWDVNRSLPTKESIDFILSNFAVFNSIYEIDLLFDRLAGCMAKNGVLMISVLHGFPEEGKHIKIVHKIKKQTAVYVACKILCFKKPTT